MSARTTLGLGVTLVIVGVAGLLLTLTAVGPPSARAPVGQPQAGTEPEAGFIEEMVPHHEDAIAMAELALERADHDELRELAREIIRTQRAENERMRRWYREWYGTEVPEAGRSRTGLGRGGMMGGRGGMMGGQVDVEALESADEFDRAFIEQMVMHHRMGVMMARMARTTATRAEIRELADEIIETQSAEIELMTGWYGEWYGR